MRISRISPRTSRFRSLRAQLRREEGTALLEFAFSAGIFLGITIGILILCMSLFSYEYVNFAAREAARWAAVRGSECSQTSTMPTCDADNTVITNYITSLGYPLINPGNLKVSTTWYQVAFGPNASDTGATATWTACTDQCNEPGNQVQVTVSYPYSLDIPFMGNKTVDIGSSAKMVISQ